MDDCGFYEKLRVTTACLARFIVKLNLEALTDGMLGEDI